MCENSNFFTSLITSVIVFFIIAILVSVKSYLSVVLICISLMTNDVAHLYMQGRAFIPSHSSQNRACWKVFVRQGITSLCLKRFPKCL
jgi:hypothetical protein